MLPLHPGPEFSGYGGSCVDFIEGEEHHWKPFLQFTTLVDLTQLARYLEVPSGLHGEVLIDVSHHVGAWVQLGLQRFLVTTEPAPPLVVRLGKAEVLDAVGELMHRHKTSERGIGVVRLQVPHKLLFGCRGARQGTCSWSPFLISGAWAAMMQSLSFGPRIGRIPPMIERDGRAFSIHRRLSGDGHSLSEKRTCSRSRRSLKLTCFAVSKFPGDYRPGYQGSEIVRQLWGLRTTPPNGAAGGVLSKLLSRNYWLGARGFGPVPPGRDEPFPGVMSMNSGSDVQGDRAAHVGLVMRSFRGTSSMRTDAGAAPGGTPP